MKTKSNRKYIKNLSNLELTYDQINLLSWGLKFVATPIKNKTTLKKQLLTDFRDFARRMWLQYIYHGEDKNIHPFFIRTSSLLSFTFTPLHLGPFALNFIEVLWNSLFGRGKLHRAFIEAISSSQPHFPSFSCQ